MSEYLPFSKLMFRSCLILLLTTVCALSSEAQKKVRLKQADAAKGGRKNGDRYERLLGNVIFTQNNTTIYCDSAHFFKRKNSLEAFGKVKILEGDSVTITGRRLEYDGDSRVAKIRNNVVFTNASATLYTDNLDYMRSSNIAYYFKGGKLVDSATVLNSEKGYYNANTSLATFQTNVKVTNPDYTMYADSLRYNTRSKIIYFVTRTRVVNKDSSTFEYEKGVYNTITRKSDLIAGTAETENYTLVGKRYDLDAARDIAKVRGDVVLTYKEENLVIYGQASDHFKRKGITKIYDRAYVAKINDEDTLFIRADTLVSIDSPDPSKRKILAYNNVRLFKTDMQGSSDSLEYRYADSTIYFYQEPILWSEGNQLTADSIRFLLKNNTIHKMYLIANAFVINRDTLLNFNQIKGRKMTADINDGKISKVLVEGNGESLYFAIDDDNTTMMGVNKIICSNIIIRFKEGGVHNLSFLVKPEASFIPPHMLKKEDKTLKGFSWRYNEKPTRKTVIPKPAILPK